LTPYGLLAILIHGKSSQNRIAAAGQHEAGADYTSDGQCMTKAGCRVLAAFVRNSYYMVQFILYGARAI